MIIVAILVLFNFMVFVHELGHYWAALWRGLKVERFQVCFGKPIFKVQRKGVEWALGWIPAGGFVALPQMAPMETIEGKGSGEQLPPIKPLDKIIVAFAGPLFSFLLAVVFALAVWKIGTPTFTYNTTTLGYVESNSKAMQAGLKPGDKIVAIDGQKVDQWAGDMRGVLELIAMSEKPTLQFTVERPDGNNPPQRLELSSEFVKAPTKFWERSSLRSVGDLQPKQQLTVDKLFANSPAALAGLQSGDKIVSIDAKPVLAVAAVRDAIKSQLDAGGNWPQGQVLSIGIERGGKPMSVELTPKKAKDSKDYSIGCLFKVDADMRIITTHPTPWSLITKSLNWMKISFEKVASGAVGVDQLSGPVGIVGTFYDISQITDGWKKILWFAVILNVNLAVLNLLPLPVVDGGHITFALIEMLRGKPLSVKLLERIQAGFAVVLIGLFFYITFKDVADRVSRVSAPKVSEPVYE